MYQRWLRILFIYNTYLFSAHISVLPIDCRQAFLYFNTNPVHCGCHFTLCTRANSRVRWKFVPTPKLSRARTQTQNTLSSVQFNSYNRVRLLASWGIAATAVSIYVVSCHPPLFISMSRRSIDQTQAKKFRTNLLPTTFVFIIFLSQILQRFRRPVASYILHYYYVYWALSVRSTSSVWDTLQLSSGIECLAHNTGKDR